MSGLDELDIKLDYSGWGEEILEEFLLPVLSRATHYDRVTSFFTTDALVAIAAGLDQIRARNGKMRLIIGLHDVPADIAQASSPDAELMEAVESIRARVASEVASISSEIVRNRLVTLAWMMQEGFLEVKVAAVAMDGHLQSGIFHSKSMVFRDSDNNIVAAVGSPNETASGLGRNYEQITVFSSWKAPTYAATQVAVFDSLWGGTRPGVIVRPLDPSFATELLYALRRHESPTSIQESSPLLLADVFRQAAAMPSYFFVAGPHSALYPHQERAVLEALSRWPVRALLADEVGLGKTLEAGAIIAYMTKFCAVSTVVILAPKAVIRQWQSELQQHFGIIAWIYESGVYTCPEGTIWKRGSSSSERPDTILVSIQLARGQGGTTHFFSDWTKLPDLLVVDEAHSARLRPDSDGLQRPTLIWRMLKDIAHRIPHVIFASATPMQTHWQEYHGLLALLGLPTLWRKPEFFEKSLSYLMADAPPISPQDAFEVALMITSAVQSMEISEERFDVQERAAIRQLLEIATDRFDTAAFVRESWKIIWQCLVKTHPAHWLTIRNTRESLATFGYRFPVRRLSAPLATASSGLRLFYLEVEDYLTEVYFGVERALYPEKTFSIGFVRTGYQQRLASSLESCRQTLLRRRDRLECITQENSDVMSLLLLNNSEMDEDDVLEERVQAFSAERQTKDYKQVKRLAIAERQYLDGLISKVEQLQAEEPDPKFKQLLEILTDALALGKKVLVFSRYTDTVRAAEAAIVASSVCDTNYAVLTGTEARLNINGDQRNTSRAEISRALAAGEVEFVLCSDAASEGLNLQSARVLVNVDVPWNPARLEQRIGRIARLGQAAEVVEVFNLWYPGSVEEKMYRRLHERKELYDLAVGQFPDVIGDAIRKDVLKQGDDSSLEGALESLQTLRNTTQVKALSRVWSSTNLNHGLSTELREGLLATLCQSPEIECEGTADAFRLSFRRGVSHVTSTPGSTDVFTLLGVADEPIGALPLRSYSGAQIGETDKMPVAFRVGAEGEYVQPESFPRLLAHLMGIEEDTKSVSLEIRPTWLPNFASLNIPFTDSVLSDPAPPLLWPPTRWSDLANGRDV